MYKKGDTIHMNLGNIDKVAEGLFEYILNNKNKEVATLVKVRGDLGAGKTTLTKKWASILGVEGEVSSPTFVIQKEYQTKNKDFTKLVHIDAYRLEGEKDAKNIRISEVLSLARTLVVVEWPELLVTENTDDGISINIEHGELDERVLTIE